MRHSGNIYVADELKVIIYYKPTLATQLKLIRFRTGDRRFS